MQTCSTLSVNLPKPELRRQEITIYYGQQGMPPAQQNAPIAQQAPAANTVLDVANAIIAAAIFKNFVFIKTSLLIGFIKFREE